MYANYSSNNRRKTRGYYNIEPSDNLKSVLTKQINEQRVDKLLSTIFEAKTTSVLNILEEHRQKLNKIAFRTLLLLLTTEFNNATWSEKIHQRSLSLIANSFSRKDSQKQLPTPSQINQTILIVLYYIVSVINKYQINDPDPIWQQILSNTQTETLTFYRFLYNNQINIPETICRSFSENLCSFYSFHSMEDNVILIQLGFTIDMNKIPYLRIKEYERFLSQLKQKNVLNKNSLSEQLIYSNMTPEQLSLLLSYFPDYDLNMINRNTQRTILDQIIYMKPYFYIEPNNINANGYIIHRFRQSGSIRPRNTDISKIDQYPNEITKYRAARLLNLFQSVILKGGQLSQPVFSGISVPTVKMNPFFSTSIGLYALIGLRMDDIYPDEFSYERDYRFVLCVIRLIKCFEPEFQEFLLRYLSLSYSIIHDENFISQQRSNETDETQNINDHLFQKILTLKEWCRLKIKDCCSQKHINQFNLPKSLMEYCSYDLLNTNYALNCIKKVTAHRGNFLPNYQDFSWEQVVEDNNDDNSEVSADNSIEDDF